MVIREVVAMFQNAFVERRQILDATLIVKEAINSMLKDDTSGIICKLDIKKAYNLVN